MNPQVEKYFSKTKKWKNELEKLRILILDCGLNEELKWNVPVYTYKEKNILGINGLKEFCTVAFFKGALLKDTNKILYTPGKVESARWIKFASVDEIAKSEFILKKYIYEAIEVEKSGLKIKKKTTTDFKMSEEFQAKINKIPALKSSFEALTPGRQRGYLYYFSQPKQSKTREARIEKYLPKILNRKGLND